jgi:hypothetical protein
MPCMSPADAMQQHTATTVTVLQTEHPPRFAGLGALAV